MKYRTDFRGGPIFLRTKSALCVIRFVQIFSREIISIQEHPLYFPGNFSKIISLFCRKYFLRKYFSQEILYSSKRGISCDFPGNIRKHPGHPDNGDRFRQYSSFFRPDCRPAAVQTSARWQRHPPGKP